MPDKGVKTIQDLLYYQYAKIIAKRAMKEADGVGAKKKHYGFIKQTLRDLQTGKKAWSEITHEDKQLVEVEKRCIYCGSDQDLQWEHIVPKSVRINERCPTCEKILGIHNQIWGCQNCNLAKRTKGLHEFYRSAHPGEKKYLKTIYACHVWKDKG